MYSASLDEHTGYRNTPVSGRSGLRLVYSVYSVYSVYRRSLVPLSAVVAVPVAVPVDVPVDVS